MQKLQAINQKITDLQKQRDALERQAAWSLFVSVKEILKEDFDPHLVVGLVKDTWRTRTPQKQEGWKTSARPFRRAEPSRPKDPKTNAAPDSP